MWAQALGFETTKSEVDLSAAKKQNLTLTAMTDPERRWRQLPGEVMVAALPEATADDARIKKVFTNQCTGCHSPGYVLQFRFDEPGWNKIINLMKMVANTGVMPANPKANEIIRLSPLNERDPMARRKQTEIDAINSKIAERKQKILPDVEKAVRERDRNQLKKTIAALRERLQGIEKQEEFLKSEIARLGGGARRSRS